MANENRVLDPIGERLRAHPFAAGLGTQYIAELAAIASGARFAQNEIILEEGEESANLYLITSGRVVLEISEVERPFRVDILAPGEEFGWSWALGTPGVYQVRALDPVEALVIPASTLIALCDRDTAFGYTLMRRMLGVVAKRLAATRVTVIDMYLPAAKRAGA